MSAGTSAALSLLFVSIVFVSAEQKNIKAESGQNVTLTCQASNNNIVAVEWSRADLGSQYVLYYRGKHLDSANQHPSFKNRVDLQDRQMKDGNVSLILSYVMINDTGTYECHVAQRETSQEIADLKLIHTINLRVAPPGSGGAAGLKAGLSVFGLLLAAAAVYVEF